MDSQYLLSFEKHGGEWDHPAENQALCLKRECAFHHVFHPWLYGHDCVGFLIREGPQEDVILASSVCGDSSNPAIQISASTQSTTRAEDGTELAAAISR